MKKRFLGITALFCWAGLIFYFSSQPYREQDLTGLIGKIVNSQVWGERLSNFSLTYSGREISVKSLGLPHFIEFFIRKGAHLGAFFMLGFLTNAVGRLFTGRKWITACGALAFVFVYACSDEVHQYFTGDRTPLFADVILDSCGGLVGIIIYNILSSIRKNKRSSSSQTMF